MTRAAIEELSAVQSPPKGFCMGCQTFKSESDMTTLHTGVQKRRMCVTCKNNFLDRREAERRMKAWLSQ